MQLQSLGRVVAAFALGALGSLSLGAPAAQALTVTLDAGNGAVYDAVGDGWFFAGGPAIPPDGVGDLGGNALAIAYQAGVVEMRGMSEFPLAPLAGYTAAEITSATLTVTIDDVLSTLGPGTTFDGTAASPFAAYSYTANGVVTPADFSPAGLAPLGTITPGVITDATLAISNAVPFTLDVTASVKAYVTAAATHYGVLLGTLDSATGTSLNAAAPGVPGGALPFITIVITPEAPPVYSKAQLKCATTIAKAGASLAAAEQKGLGKCLDTILKLVAGGEPAANATDACLKLLDGTNPASALSKAKAKVTTSIPKACEGLTPADVHSPCDAGATTFDDTATCIVTTTSASVESMIKDRYAKGCVLLEAVGLDTAFPDVCN